MLNKFALATAAMLLTVTPALAHHCPMDAAAIDHALMVASVGDDVKAQVTALKDKGMAEHKAGDHAAAETTLAEAMRLLLNSMQ
jgi:hypothetical protein